jgi:hypothetical protein
MLIRKVLISNLGRDIGCTHWSIPWFPSVPLGKLRDYTSVMPLPLPSISIPIHRQSVLLPFRTMESKSLNTFNISLIGTESLLNYVCLLRHWRWRRYVPPRRRLKLNGLHGVMSQKMILFVLKYSTKDIPKFVMFEVLTAVTTLWVVRPCTLLELLLRKGFYLMTASL